MGNGFSVGLDFGTGSARALLVDVASGQECGTFVEPYRHGVLETALPGGTPLPGGWALQHPQDYLDALEALLRHVASQQRRLGGDVLGIGVSCTSCTVLPTTAAGTPLACEADLAERPHAYPKLWKHHAAEPYARRIGAGSPYFLEPYGGRTSAEWSLAKAWEVIDQDPDVWERSRWWIDAGDWLVWSLVGEQVRSRSQAGCKNHWQPAWGGYPDAGVLRSLHAGLESWRERLADPQPVGSPAGGLSRQWAWRTGLPAGTPVAVAAVDAESALPGSDVRGPGPQVVVLGTSTCSLGLSNRARPRPGLESVVAGGAIPGYYDYCTGQAATGDMLTWWVRMLAGANGTPSPAAEQRVFAELNADLGQRRGPGAVRVMDWWNGCRTPLSDTGLTGTMSGLRLDTSAGDIYAGMVEAMAAGTRLALELIADGCGGRSEIRATGSLAQVPAIMQTYANVLGHEVRASQTRHGSARGAAYYGATAAGVEMAPSLTFRCYEPEAADRYEPAYQAYLDQVDAHRRG